MRSRDALDLLHTANRFPTHQQPKFPRLDVLLLLLELPLVRYGGERRGGPGGRDGRRGEGGEGRRDELREGLEDLGRGGGRVSSDVGRQKERTSRRSLDWFDMERSCWCWRAGRRESCQAVRHAGGGRASSGITQESLQEVVCPDRVEMGSNRRNAGSGRTILFLRARSEKATTAKLWGIPRKMQQSMPGECEELGPRENRQSKLLRSLPSADLSEPL